MGNARIGDTGHAVGFNGVALCQLFTAAAAHGFHVDALISGGRIAVIRPKESANSHFVAALSQSFAAFGRETNDLTGAELTNDLVSRFLRRENVS